MPSIRTLHIIVLLLVVCCLSLAALAVYSSAAGIENPDRVTANWTRILAIVTAIGLMGQLTFVARADRTATMTARAALDANRPWLDFDVKIAGPLARNGSWAGSLVAISITNIGKSPAVWTNVIAVIDHLGHDIEHGSFGLRSAAVFQGGKATRNIMAPLYDIERKGIFGDSHLVLKVTVIYPLFGTSELGKTSKRWDMLGPFIGAVNLDNLPISQIELTLRHQPDRDFAA